jgi:ElaB/YqjD/DUF883 family membrane-anchored ribosome-binding protein
MARLDTVRSEIEALLKELKELESERSSKSSVAPESDETGKTMPEPTEGGRLKEAIEALQGLHDQLIEAARETGDAVTEHPFAATASAFMLGLIVGRLSR